MAPAVQIADLRKRYGRRTVVDGLSLDVESGEIVALLGPNGAGKTTTTECVAGLRRPDGGSVRVLGRDPHSERDRVVPALGVMLQEGGAWPAATARQMLRLYASFYADPMDPDELAQHVGLAGELTTVRFRSLSGGEKQRLHLALALIGRPRVLLVDEPTASMDPHARRSVWQLFQDLRDEGVAILLTTHDLTEAGRLADRVAIIAAGTLRATGTPEALRAHGGGDLEEAYLRLVPGEGE